MRDGRRAGTTPPVPPSDAACDPGPTPDALCAECKHHAALHWVGEKCQECPCERFVHPSDAAFFREPLPTKPDPRLRPWLCSDPFARGGDRHWFWWADATYLRPGLYLRHRCVLRVSMWLLRPRYSWNVRGYGRRWT